MKNWLLLIGVMVLLTGCNFSNTKKDEIMIEPYQLNEEEEKLTTKTGVTMIFFKLNGSLKENED